MTHWKAIPLLDSADKILVPMPSLILDFLSFFFLRLYLLILRERREARGRKRTSSRLHTKCRAHTGLNPTTMRS